MLTDYERYQLEWMIEHGHSLKEFVQGLDLVDRDGIDSLEEAYAIWENDYGFGGEVFSNEREFKEEDLPAMNVGAHGETLRQMVADTSEMPVKAVKLIKGLYVVEGAMAQDHGIDYLFDNIGILTASVRDMLSREAERGQWEGQYKSLIDKCEEMRGDEEWDCRDTDTLVDGFAKAVEHEADAAFEVARIKGELSMYNAAYYNPETGDLIVSYLTDYEDPTVEVFSYGAEQYIVLVQRLVPVNITVDLEYRAAEFILGIVCVILRQCDAAADKSVRNLDLNDLSLLLDRYRKQLFAQNEALGLLDLAYEPVAGRDLFEAESAILGGYGCQQCGILRESRFGCSKQTHDRTEERLIVASTFRPEMEP